LKNFLVFFFLLPLCGIMLQACSPTLIHTPPEEYLKKSASIEQTGDITAAIEELKIALTIDPGNNAAKEQLKRLSETRDKEAEKHYKTGLSLKESDYPAALREFLAALRIKPDYQVVVGELKTKQYAISESKLQSRTTAHRGSAEKKTSEKADVEEEGDYDYIGFAMSLYNNGEYQAAIGELLKARSRYPRNAEISKYLNLSYYNLGVLYYKKKDYMNALNMFSNVKRGDGKTEDYLKKIWVMLKNMADEYYKAGLKFFREQKLNEAIGKWNIVLQIDPHHQKAKEYIQKSKKLLEALKQ
jgi:tetratricopeptide (TPR) repeat protein